MRPQRGLRHPVIGSPNPSGPSQRELPVFERDIGYTVQMGRVNCKIGPEPEVQIFFGERSPPRNLSAMGTRLTATTAPHPHLKSDLQSLSKKPFVFPKRGVPYLPDNTPINCVAMLRESIRELLQRAHAALEDAAARTMSGQIEQGDLCGLMESSGLAISTSDIRSLSSTYGRGSSGSSINVRAMAAHLLQLIRRPLGCYQSMPWLVTAVTRRLKFMAQTLGMHWQRTDMEMTGSYEIMPGSASGFVHLQAFEEGLQRWGFSLGPKRKACALLAAYDTNPEGVYAGFVNYRDFLRDFGAACVGYFNSGGFDIARIKCSDDLYALMPTRTIEAARSQNISRAVGSDSTQRSMLYSTVGSSQQDASQAGGRPRQPSASALEDDIRDQSTAQMQGRALPALKSVDSIRDGSVQGLNVSNRQSYAFSKSLSDTAEDSTCQEALGNRLKDYWDNIHVFDQGIRLADSRRTGNVSKKEFVSILTACSSRLSGMDIEYICRRFGDQKGKISYDAFYRWTDEAAPVEFLDRATAQVPKNAFKEHTNMSKRFKPLVDMKRLQLPSRGPSYEDF